LDYATPATPAAPDPARPRHPAAVTWLILLRVVAAFVCGAVGVLFIDVAGPIAGGLMAAGAVALMIAVFGFLARPRPGFGVGAVLVGMALLAAGGAFVTNQRTVQRLERKIVAGAAPTSGGGVVVVDSRSQLGKDLCGLYFARTTSAAAAGLEFCLLVYLLVRCFARRPLTNSAESN
jgi:hypothetical protein